MHLKYIFNTFNCVSKDRYSHISDNELLQRFWQSRNNDWLGVLLQRYTLLLLGVCMKYLKDEQDARDCVQQIFVKVIQEASKYQIGYFKSWLYMVAKNQCLTILRDRKGKVPIEITEANGDIELHAENSIDLKDEILSEGLLQEALNELNAEQYESVTLFYLQKKSYQEISDLTGQSLMKVKSFIQNGKRNLKINIEKNNHVKS